MSCPPKGAAPTALPSDPCVRLAMFEQAAFMLASGDKRAEIRHGDHFVRFHQSAAQIAYLEREIKRLRVICGARSGAGDRTAITIARTPSGVPPRY